MHISITALKASALGDKYSQQLPSYLLLYFSRVRERAHVCLYRRSADFMKPTAVDGPPMTQKLKPVPPLVLIQASRAQPRE